MTIGTILRYLLLLFEFEYIIFFVTFFFWKVCKPEKMLPNLSKLQVRKQAKKNRRKSNIKS
jgi:hypothetical protein